MSLNLAAQHLASKGRHGDDSLVHVSKGELAGLQALAKSHGKSLTVNPQTGLPEAFSLKSLLPMAAGAALMATGVGAPLAAGIVGGGTFLATGSLKQGLMAGLGAYGGAGLMGGLTTTGATEVAGEAAAKEAAANQAEQAIAQQTAAQQQASLNTLGQSATTPQAIENVASQQTAFNAQPYDAANAADMSYVTPANQLPQSAYTATVTPEQVAAAKANTGVGELASRGFTSLGSEVGRDAAISGMGGGMKATQYGLAAASPAIADAMTPDPYMPPELKSDADMGQRYKYESGYDASIPGRTANPSYTKISDEEARKLYGYAQGGVTRMASGGASPSVGYEPSPYSGSQYSGYGAPSVGNYSGYDTPVIAGLPAARQARASTISAPTNGMVYDPTTQSYVGSGPGGDTIYQGGGQYGLTEAAQKAADEAAAAAAAPADSGGGYAAGGGISTLGGYSDGGRLLKGPGDGMSDNIPAQIGAKQPARLADGEFVVPADVVSHLGNGSTDAGAKQLYKMMDKIRQARTGRKAQGKQINPNKYMPA